MDNARQELENNIRSLSDDGLIEMLTARSEYRSEAIQIAEDEKAKRGILEPTPEVQVEAQKIVEQQPMCPFGWRKWTCICFFAVVASVFIPQLTDLIDDIFGAKQGSSFKWAVYAIMLMWFGIIREMWRAWRQSQGKVKRYVFSKGPWCRSNKEG